MNLINAKPQSHRATITKKSFTLIELLIVLGIIAVLWTTVIRQFVGFDAEARITATKTNLDTLRMQVILFRGKEGRYPDSLQELLDTYYFDVGVKKPYLTKIPPEMISKKTGNNEFIDLASSEESITDEGGWVYYTDTAEVKVNIDTPLDRRWGEYEGQRPIDW